MTSSLPLTRPSSHAGLRRRGTMLVGILVGLMLLAGALVAVAVSGRREQDMTMRRMEAMRARYAQEAVAQIAVRELINQQDDDGDGAVGTVAGGVLASGITIGSSKGATASASAGDGIVLQPQGSNGLASHAGAVTIASSNYVTGLYADCFLTSNPTSINDITWTGTPTAVGIVPNVNMSVPNATAMWWGGPHTNYAVRFRGSINIPAAGSWTFYTTSADGSILWINGTQVVNNDGNHAAATQSGSITLPAGNASFELKYYTRNASDTIIASWSGPTVAGQTVIPPSAFTCDPVLEVPPIAGHTLVSLAGTTVDGYASKSGAYGGSNITSAFRAHSNGTTASRLDVSGGQLAGNATCGVGGVPATVITTSSGGTISGTRTAATSNVAVFRQTEPLNSLPFQGPLSVTGTTTLSADGRYESIEAVTTNAKIIISGHRIIQCGSMNIGGNCTLEFAADSSLRLYINNGDLDLSGTCQVNANTADPTRLQVCFTNPSDQFKVYDSAVFHGYAFNPGGGLYLYSAGSPAAGFHGVFHGTEIDIGGTAVFHADASFGSPTAASTVLTAWRQTQ
ncbi:MAG: hypothetical protein RL689_251 [Planctomycetota bacterium]